ncbi:PiggyBac transposable element-derived protein 4 [Plakobranchus ocellatus]|uniref:PiggyBac transposable element-derived protein 4 n=1 Tax=Plakobranchus ocellatus TaxID=259542 RepID=A0AAV4A3S8_9GAST|nr:PiggyBac transposable element-derived protein 4 [Plakobranchus ocellatus]
MFSTQHIVVGVQLPNLIHSLLLVPKRTEKVTRKCKKTVEVSKPVPADKLSSTLVHRGVTSQEDLNSLQEVAQYPLNRLKQFLSSPGSEVLVSLHPRSSGKCAVSQATGNHLQLTESHDQRAPGVDAPLNDESTPLDYFCQLFGEQVRDTLISSINDYAAHKVAMNTPAKKYSVYQNWKPITLYELYKFLAVIVQIGLDLKPQIRDYWDKSDTRYSPWYSTDWSRP